MQVQGINKSTVPQSTYGKRRVAWTGAQSAVGGLRTEDRNCSEVGVARRRGCTEVGVARLGFGLALALRASLARHILGLWQVLAFEMLLGVVPPQVGERTRGAGWRSWRRVGRGWRRGAG